MKWRVHELKCWPAYFNAVAEGHKRFELRRDDRGFVVGDVLNLREWLPQSGYTGRTVCVRVTYLCRGVPDFGLMDGFCIMSIERMGAREEG